jgi:serine/threonine protein kinase
MLTAETDRGFVITIPRQIGPYVANRVIGQGNSCVMVEGIHEFTGDSVAIKVMHRANITKSIQQNKVRQELALTKILSHENIVDFEETIEIGNLVCIVMELCEGGDLLSLLLDSELSDSERKQIFKGVAAGVKYLHDLGLTHGDLKPENVMLTEDGIVKLIDFAYSTKRGCGTNENKSGTLVYAAPELLKPGNFDGIKADVWALGILLYVLFTVRMPYMGTSDSDIGQQIVQGAIVYPPEMDSELKRVIQSLTRLNPNDRPEVSEILEDAFFDDAEEQQAALPVKCLPDNDEVLWRHEGEFLATSL